MKKTFTDNWGKEHSLIGLNIYGYEDGGFTINDGAFVMASYVDAEGLIDDLELTEEEIKLLDSDCNFYVSSKGLERW